VTISGLDAVQGYPVVVDDGRARLEDGHAHHTGQFESVAIGHALFLHGLENGAS
jgi:hypothetical protein